MAQEIKISVLTPTLRPEGLEILQKCLKEQTFQDFEWLVEINYSGKHDLNQAWNSMLKRAKGELIVFYEDYTKINPDGLQKFWEAYKNHPDTMFTAPLGKTKHKQFLHEDTELKWDWRLYRLGEIKYDECEMDWGASPIKILKEIGGFDERLDQFWSLDNVSVCKRADMLGYKFRNINNLAVAYDHDAFIEHPFRKDYKPALSNMIMDDYKENPKLDYL